jgi:hypothetical protein
MKRFIFLITVIFILAQLGLHVYFKCERNVQEIPDTTIHEDDYDPFEDEMVGFPKAPLTIETGLFCDVNTNIILRGHWNCPEDPTCKSCSQRNIMRFRKIEQTVSKYNFVKWAMSMPSKIIFVTAINDGQMFLFENFISSIRTIGMKPEEMIMPVATDQNSHKKLINLGFHKTPLMKELSIDKRYNIHTANVGGHADINNVMLLVANQVLQRTGKNVALHDVDIVWFRDIRPWLIHAGRRRDFLAQTSPYDVAKGVINTGFVYFRNTARSRLFVQSLVNVAPLKKDSDQKLFNIVLRHRFFNQLGYRILPQRLFYKYDGRRAKPVNKSEALLFHAVGTDKQDKLKRYGLWYK